MPQRGDGSEYLLIVILPEHFAWAKGETETEALKAAMPHAGLHRAPRLYEVWEVHPETVVDTAGDFRFPKGFLNQSESEQSQHHDVARGGLVRLVFESKSNDPDDLSWTSPSNEVAWSC